jgi:hypothetical protein
MRVALYTTFAASKGEPLAEVVGRVHKAFLDAGLAEPTIRFTLADRATSVSAADRVLKRHPEMDRFFVVDSPVTGHPGVHGFSNATTGEAAEYSTILAIAAGSLGHTRLAVSRCISRSPHLAKRCAGFLNSGTRCLG